MKENTEKIIEKLSYDELKRKIAEDRKGYLKSLNIVSTDESRDLKESLLFLCKKLNASLDNVAWT